MYKPILFAVLVLMMVQTGSAQNPGTTGSYGLLYTHEGRSLRPGQLNFYLNTNMYSKQDAWLWANNLAASAGIFDNLDLTAALRAYQTTNFPNKSNVPDDIFVALKAGSFTFEQGRFASAIILGTRIPVGEVHNYPFAEYASGSVEYGVKGAVSYFMDPYLPHRSTSIHFNIGWWNHNEKGKDIDLPDSSVVTATKNSSKLEMALALRHPVSTLFALNFELYGYLFTDIPDGFVYSAEDMAVFTPSVEYRPLSWLSVTGGVDIRINSADRNRTGGVPEIDSPMGDLKNYPPWKVHLNLTLYAMGAEKDRTSLVDYDNRRIRKLTEFYDMVEVEKEKSKEVEKDVQQLRKTRQSTDDDIRNIKDTLQGEN
jgi:hypothetical protein